MSKRNTQQRRHTIIAELSNLGEVSVDSLAKKFDTSEVTAELCLYRMKLPNLKLKSFRNER